MGVWEASADFEISDFGFAICDCGEVVGEKPVFKGVCAVVGICAGVAGDDSNFFGKSGSAEVSSALGWWGGAADEPGNSGVWPPSGSRGRSPHRLDSGDSE